MGKLTVRKYDYANKRYVRDAAGKPVDVEVLTGKELDEHLVNEYKTANSAGKRLYMQDQGIHLSDVFARMGITPKDFGAAQIRAIITDDNLRPWFGPVTEDGIRIGMQPVQDRWEALIGAAIPVTQATGEWYFLEDPATDDAYNLKTLNQGAIIPVATIMVSKQPVVLEKKGRGLQLTREAQRAPMALGQVWMKVVGMRLGRSYLGLAAARLINGYADDGSDMPIVIDTATPNVFTLNDLLTARWTMEEVYGFTPTTLVLSLNSYIGLLTMQLNGTQGALVFPNGVASIKEVLQINDVQIVNAIDDTQMVFENNEAGLVRYVVDEFATEDEYLPRQQLYSTYGTMTDQIIPGVKEARIVLNADHV